MTMYFAPVLFSFSITNISCHSYQTKIETHNLKTVTDVKSYSASNGGAILPLHSYIVTDEWFHTY